VLAVTIALVGALAFALGLVFARRAGFCNGLCPVLPVEKLYGQAPMVGVGSSRCGDCSHCAPLACVDLAGGASALVSLGPGRRSNRWVLTPFGSFAAAFPGFVLGYFTTANGPAATAPAIYGHVALWSAVSWAVVYATAATLSLGASRLLPSLGALAAGEYYWFAAASMANTLGLGTSGAVGIRLLSLSLVAWWWVTAWRRDPAV
jgi:hypothetical protein